MDEIYFEHAGARLYATARGAGGAASDAIIVLHGGLATNEACWRFAAPLAARSRVVAPDLRASGRSHWSGELSWDLLADDIAALARHLGITRATIGGVSFGAGCAVRVALRHPALAARLVVLHPAYDGVALAPAQRAAMNAMRAAGERALVDGIAALFPLLETLPAPVRERARALVATYDPASVAALTRFMASGVQPFAQPELAAIAVPVTVVPGADPQHPAEVAAIYARYIARCTVVATDDFAAAIAG